ncbi:MAG: VCBS repeat-containing protein, partial [Candidatus Zixiibacteriota bacterium]
MLAISKASTAAVIICVIIVGGAAFAQAPQVVSTSPAQNDLNVPTDASISVTFDVNMEAWTINLSSFVVNARSTGFHPGTISYDSETRTAVLTPFQAFTIGEVVTVVLTTDIRSAGGASLADGFSWSFTIVAPGGTGTFAAPTLSEAGHSSIVASDLNGDGALDLATQGGWVLLNNGDGTFGDPSYYNVGYAPHMIIAADLDSDGYIDLITGDEMSCVTVVLNDGSGKFPMPVQFPVKTYAPSVFAADFDNDGDMDIVTGNETADVSVLINKGDATFETHVEYAVAGPYVFVSAADFDGDGFADVAAACGNSSVVSVLLNNGDGTFASPATYSVGESCLGIYSADIDADGDCDIVTGNHDSKDVSVLLNNGDGTFAPKRSYPTGGSPWSIIAADVDGDGKLDLITAGTGYTGPDSTISVLVNEGDGTFAPYVEYQAGGNPWSVCAGDFDRDGDLDLATSYISVLFNLNPVVGVASAFPGQNELNVPISFDVSVAFDRDVDMSSVNDSTFIVHTPSAGLQEGSVSYDSLSRTATFTPDAPFHEGDMVTAVLSDGIQPLNPFHVFEPYSWSFTIEADEAFGTFVLDSAYELGEDPHYPFAADFDGDSDIDLAVSVRSWNRVAVLLNDGTGSLSAVSSYLAGTSPLDICGADADNDGDVDLFITHYGTSEITVLLGNGDGTFASPSSYDNGADNRSVAAVDLNGVRYIDMAIGNYNVSSVSIMLGTGDGTFGTA